MYETITKLSRVLVTARVSSSNAVAFVPTGIVLNEKLIVFPFAEDWRFAALQSVIHWSWAWQYGSTLKEDLNYSTTDAYLTFVFPKAIDQLKTTATCCENHRRQVMLSRQEGLTKTYNRFHAPDESSADIQKLRQLHVEMDHSVAAAYGWTDLGLGHGFHQTKQGLRYTISEPARREVLARLLKLNHERYAEEVAKGLHEKKKSRGTKEAKAKPNVESHASLFGEEG